MIKILESSDRIDREFLSKLRHQCDIRSDDARDYENDLGIDPEDAMNFLHNFYLDEVDMSDGESDADTIQGLWNYYKNWVSEEGYPF